jgi:hypothetical protein
MPTEQPGIAALRDLIKATYPTKTSFSAWRPCGKTSSEHYDGRALDFMLNAADPNDRAIADAFLGWLLATDAQGNRYANARRLGVMYLIWNTKMWRAYRADAGWLAYTGSVPHTDHIHISLSWAGARQQTSFYGSALAPLDVYTTPGVFTVNGRQWSTTCAAYGADGAKRCVANVWATVVSWENRTYVMRTGWSLARITYVDLVRPFWDANHLSVPGQWVSSGRQWKTECSSADISKARICKASSYRVVAGRTKTATGYTYHRAYAWALTYVVKLSVPAATTPAPTPTPSPTTSAGPTSVR